MLEQAAQQASVTQPCQQQQQQPDEGVPVGCGSSNATRATALAMLAGEHVVHDLQQLMLEHLNPCIDDHGSTLSPFAVHSPRLLCICNAASSTPVLHQRCFHHHPVNM